MIGRNFPVGMVAVKLVVINDNGKGASRYMAVDFYNDLAFWKFIMQCA